MQSSLLLWIKVLIFGPFLWPNCRINQKLLVIWLWGHALDYTISKGHCPRIRTVGSSLKKVHFWNPIWGTLLSGETDQGPYFARFSTDQYEIWCVKAPLEDVNLYQISFLLVEKCPSYKAFCFYYKIATLLHFIVRRKSLFWHLGLIFNFSS